MKEDVASQDLVRKKCVELWYEVYMGEGEYRLAREIKEVDDPSNFIAPKEAISWFFFDSLVSPEDGTEQKRENRSHTIFRNVDIFNSKVVYPRYITNALSVIEPGDVFLDSEGKISLVAV